MFANRQQIKIKKNFTNPIFKWKSEKPENEFEVSHVKDRGYAEDPMGPGEILAHQ